MTDIDLAPRRPTVRDTAALIGLLATLEGEVWGTDEARDDRLPPWAEHLARRLARDGLVSPGAGSAEVQRALGDLNQRLRYVLGEHDEPERRS